MLTIKHIVRYTLLIVGFVIMGLSARAYSFSSVASSGQTLYFEILTDSTVSITYPNLVNGNYYYGVTSPAGVVIVPSEVAHSGNTYRVVSLGSYAFYGCSGLTALELPNTITSIGSNSCALATALTSVSFPSSLTSIYDNAFMGCTSLTAAEIPNDVTMIGVGAFQGCSSLARVSLGQALTTIGNVAFEGCSSIRSITIPDAVSMVGNWAFCNCTSLDSLYVGKSVIYIMQNTFAGCSNVRYIHYNAQSANCFYLSAGVYKSSLPVSSLTHLIVGDSVNSLQQYSFADAVMLDTVYLGYRLANIHNTAFSNCSNVRHLLYNAGAINQSNFPTESLGSFAKLSTIEIGGRVTSLPNQAFAQKDSLATVVMSNSVDTIGDSCFYGCQSLSNVQLSGALRYIGSSAFRNCSQLSGTLVLPSTLAYIGSDAFNGCASISGSLVIPDALHTIGLRAFQNCDNLLSVIATNAPLTILNNAFSGCDRLFQVSLGNNATFIGNAAFRECIRLSDISFGSSLLSIGMNAFNGCSRLSYLVLPNSLSAIGDSAFYGCSLLGATLTFPASITSIGDAAFANIANINVIEMRSTVPPIISASTFASATASTRVLVPCGSMLSYYVANHWEDFSIINESAPFVLAVDVNDTIMGSVQILQQPSCDNYSARIQASSNPGYHFIRWNDGNTVNPRQVNLFSDSLFRAHFVSDYSYITAVANDTARGSVSGSGLYSYNDTVVLTASANAGYHFQYWSDGVTTNPRILMATQDSILTAIFLSNISNITVNNNNPSMGTVSGGGVYYYTNQAVITAIPNYGYHFTSWHDGNVDNPRTVIVSQDSSFTANFAVNSYLITASANNASMGLVQGGGNYNYLSSAVITAIANYGYHFTQWNDGNMDNPRNIQVNSDSVFVAHFVPNTYQVTVISNDSAMGSVFGGGIFNYGSTTPISAVPANGYHFVQWNDGDTLNPRTVTISGNATYTAQFALNSYPVMVYSANPAMGSVSGGGTFGHGAVAHITATPVSGYHFTQWDDGVTDNPRTIIVTGNASFTAQFAINSYSISAVANNNALGSVTGGGTYVYNSVVTLTATPQYGYHFTQWNDGSTINPRVISVTGDANYVAQFDTNRYSVTAFSSNYLAGSVLGSGTYVYLAQVILTAVPMPHYHFVQWTDSITANPRTVLLTYDTVFSAQFAIDTHNVAAISADTVKGQVFGGGRNSYASVIYLTATPNYGYHFTQWSDGNTQNPRRFVVSDDTVIVALFANNTYVANISSNDTSLGIVSGGGSFDYLTSLTLTATPVGNSRFVSWNDGIIDNPRTISLESDTALTAIFVTNNCILTAQSNDTAMGDVFGSGVYNYLSYAVIQAVPSPHHHFSQWSDGVSTNPRQVNMLYDTVFTAIFVADTQYYIYVSSNIDSLGSVTGEGLYYYGDTVVISATPVEHALFSHWSDGVTDNPRMITAICPMQFEAIFEPETFQVTLSVNDAEMGAVYGEGRYEYGSQVVLTAVAFPYYDFRCWSDGDSTNPRVLTLTSDTIITATFYDYLSINDPSSINVKVVVDRQTIHLQGTSQHKVTVFDLSGRIIFADSHAQENLVIQLPAAGVYMLCIDNKYTQKIISL